MRRHSRLSLSPSDSLATVEGNPDEEKAMSDTDHHASLEEPEKKNPI